jgi:copper chaperone CopZ
MPTFTVNGMNCGHCTKTITDALLGIDPTLIIKTDIEHKTVTVLMSNELAGKDDINTESIKNVIVDAGYEVTAVVP